MTLERNADNSGREFWAWIFWGCLKSWKKRTRQQNSQKKFAIKFCWEICLQCSLNSLDQNREFTPNPLCRASGSKSVGGSQKGGFRKGGFGRCSPCTEIPSKKSFPAAFLDPKTRTRAHSPKPPFYKTALLFPLKFALWTTLEPSENLKSSEVKWRSKKTHV